MWWKRRQKGQLTPEKDAVARMIADKIVTVQVRMVKTLQRWERKCSTRQKKLLLLIFCIACGGYCLFILGQALFSKTEKHRSPQIQVYSSQTEAPRLPAP